MRSPPLNLFICYSREDEKLREGLVDSLSRLQRDNLIKCHYDRMAAPGIAWEEKILNDIRSADIVVLLVSQYFYKSNYCQDRELPLIMERYKKGEIEVIPVIARPVDWSESDLDVLQVLPGNARPVISWKNKDEAWADVAFGIKQVVYDLLHHIPRSRPTEIERVLRPFRTMSDEIRRTIADAKSIWLLTRSGQGWWKDFGEEFNALLRNSGPNRFVVLNPRCRAFKFARHEWGPWPYEPTVTFDDYRAGAESHLRVLRAECENRRSASDSEPPVKAVEAIVPMRLLIVDPLPPYSQVSRAFVEYPILRCRESSEYVYQGKPILTVTPNEARFFNLMCCGFDEIWKNAKSLRQLRWLNGKT